MLIPSPRHTPTDLALWAAHQTADLAAGYPNPAAALAALSEFATGGRCYASCSWGKDSVVICHLIHRSGLPIPVVNLRVSPTRNPYCDTVRDRFLSRFPLDYHEIPVDYSGCGEWFTEWWNTASYHRWDAGWREAVRWFGRRHISGVRAAESGGRKIRMRCWGQNSPLSSAPIGWWTTPQVFAYLAAHDLPAHPNYAMLGGGRWPRERLRVAELGDTMGQQYGRGEWEREYYGDLLRRLESVQSEE